MKAKDLPVKEAAMQGFGQAMSTGLKYMDHNRIQEWVDAQTNLPTDPEARREAIMTEFPIYARYRFYGSIVGLLAAGYMAAQGKKGSDLVAAAGINMATDVVDLAGDMMLKIDDVHVYPAYGRAAVTYTPRGARARPPTQATRARPRAPIRVPVARAGAPPVPMRQQNGQSGVKPPIRTPSGGYFNLGQ